MPMRSREERDRPAADHRDEPDLTDERGERVARFGQRAAASGSSMIGESEPSKSTSTAARGGVLGQRAERVEHDGVLLRAEDDDAARVLAPARRRTRHRLDLRRAVDRGRDRRALAVEARA